MSFKSFSLYTVGTLLLVPEGLDRASHIFLTDSGQYEGDIRS